MKFLGAEDVLTMPVIAGSLKVIPLGNPAAPTVTPNATGSTTYTYSIVAVDAVGAATGASVATTIANGPAALDASHTITVSWTAPPGTAYVLLLRTAGGPSQGAIASGGSALPITGGSFVDNGAPAVAYGAPATDQTGVIQGYGYVAGQKLIASGGAFIQSTIPVPGTLDQQAPGAVYHALSTTAPTTIFTASVKAGTLGATGCVRVTLFGDMLTNSGTPSWTFAITFGGVTLWKDTSPTFGAGTIRFPWRLEFILANAGGTSVQVLGGSLMMGFVTAATTGAGDISAAAKLANPIYGTAGVDTTVAQALTVTVQPSVNNALVEITVQYALTEVMP